MKRHPSVSAMVWLSLGALYFMIPLLATLLYSLQSGPNYSYQLTAYGQVIHDSEFWETLRLSATLSLETILISLVLFFLFGSFFGDIPWLGPYWAVLLIGIGVLILLRPLVRIGRKKKGE